MINRQEFDKIKEKIERKKDEPCYGNIFIDERNTTSNKITSVCSKSFNPPKNLVQ